MAGKYWLDALLTSKKTTHYFIRTPFKHFLFGIFVRWDIVNMAETFSRQTNYLEYFIRTTFKHFLFHFLFGIFAGKLFYQSLCSIQALSHPSSDVNKLLLLQTVMAPCILSLHGSHPSTTNKTPPGRRQSIYVHHTALLLRQ
jgi:hypothetical protein